MVNKWKNNPSRPLSAILFLAMFFSLIFMPRINAQRYIMTYLYGTGDYVEMIGERDNKFNEVSPSYFDINENGTLKLNYIDKMFVDEMKNRNIKIVPFLSNHWDRNVGRKAVQNYENLSSQIAEAVRNNGLDGVNVDIENLTEVDRENYINLVKRLKEKMPQDKILAVSVAANPTEINIGWQGSYDYNELVKYSDYIMIMAYDEHYEGGTAGPVASIEFVEKSIQYALKNVNKEKIVLGIPLYGRCWDIKTNTGGTAVSLKQLDEIIERYDSKVTYDEISKSPKAIVNIKSTDKLPKVSGKTLSAGQYEFWYENEESIAAKLDLIEKYDIKGVGMWKVGLETPSVWSTIAEKMGKTVIETERTFSDVIPTYWAYEYIQFVNEKGLMIGKTQTEFKPEDSLTRGELATIISRIIEDKNIKLTPKDEAVVNFSDISNHWAKDHISKLQQFGIINGYENNEFRPDNTVTRAEVSAIVSRLLAQSQGIEDLEASNIYSDVASTHWAHKYISNLGKYGIINGYTDGTFGPEKCIKRGETAKIIKKFYEIAV